MGEFLQIVGLPVSIGVVCSAVFGIFLLVERVTSPTKRLLLSNFLRSTDWEVWPQRLPAAIRESFEAIFGNNHFSIKCIARSVLFSVLAIFVLLLLGFINHYSYFKTMPGFIIYKPAYRIIFFGWIIWSMCIDYLNLLKTRLIIRAIEWTNFSIVIFFVFIVFDLLFSFLVFGFSYEFLDALNMSYQLCVEKCTIEQTIFFAISAFRIVSVEMNLWALKFVMILAGPISNEIAVFFWAGLLPTLWLLIYVLATTATRIMVKLSGLIAYTVSWLDVDRPFQSIGFVAASLVGIYMAISALAVKLI